MNFKFTPLKIIISLLALIIGDYALSSAIICLDTPCNISKLMLTPGLILAGLICSFIVYLICSLFQKKK